jgi:phosphoribosylaminoimidazole-succinocarboxamide synthase
MVVRGYLCGHAWRIYKAGGREICGVTMPDGMKENDKFPEPIITPAVKNHTGHDVDISLEDIVKNKYTNKKYLDQLVEKSLQLFARGTELAAKRGLILVDTKYEFGIYDKKIMLIDEVHTPDSSRFFYLETYDNLQKDNLPQKQLSKEFVREWLMANGFSGKKDELIPEMTPEINQSITDRYVEMYETFMQEKFVPRSYENILETMEKSIQNELENLY